MKRYCMIGIILFTTLAQAHDSKILTYFTREANALFDQLNTQIITCDNFSVTAIDLKQYFKEIQIFITTKKLKEGIVVQDKKILLEQIFWEPFLKEPKDARILILHALLQEKNIKDENFQCSKKYITSNH